MLKVTAENENETRLDAMTENRAVIMSAVTKQPVGEFSGVFGMPDLNKLAYHLKNPEYKKEANIEVRQEERNGETIPAQIHFENANGDFQNDYRFMNRQIIEEKLKTAMFKGGDWRVVIEPTMAAIGRLKLMQGAHSEETVFQVKTEDGNLNFYFGDAVTHAGHFTFESGLTGSLQNSWSWPISEVVDILGLDGDKTMSIADGVMKISVDSGLAVYDYMLPAQQK